MTKKSIFYDVTDYEMPKVMNYRIIRNNPMEKDQNK